jgi:hypothetical protein
VIMDWFQNGKNQTLMAIHFRAHGFLGLIQSTLSRWLKVEQSFCDKLTCGAYPLQQRVHVLKNHAFEESLGHWIDRMESEKFTGHIGDIIKMVASRIYDALQIPTVERL